MIKLTIRSGRRGFTLIEVAVVLMIATVVLSITFVNFAAFSERTAARSAAMTFASDLRAARNFALRSREAVTITFDEDSVLYRVVSQNGSLISTGRFGEDGEYRLDSIRIDVRGDTVHFADDGAIDFQGHGVRSATASATFSAGTVSWAVEFNQTGASRRVER